MSNNYSSAIHESRDNSTNKKAESVVRNDKTHVANSSTGNQVANPPGISSTVNNNIPKAKSIGNYILGRNNKSTKLLGKSIGEGTFGKVKLATHILTGEKVAIKILEKDRILDVSDVERVAREIHILKLIRHPNIVQLYEVLNDYSNLIFKIIETPKQLFLVTEYASGGELFDYIVANQRYSDIKYFYPESKRKRSKQILSTNNSWC
jgi:Protein kinase domain